MKFMIMALIALSAILSGCTGDLPLTPPPPPPPAPTAVPQPTAAPAAPTAAPAPPAAPKPGAAPAAPAGQIVVDGIAFYHVGGDKYTPANGGCVTVPTGARLDTPQGPFYFGESVSFDTATLYTNSGPRAALPNARRLCVPSGAAPQQPQAQPAAAPAPAAPVASVADPSKDLGGQWLHVSGNKYSLTGGSHTIHGAQGWTVHTPGHPGDPGLPVGRSETTSIATGYSQ